MSLLLKYDFENPSETEKILTVQGGQGAFSFDIVSKNIDVADAVVSILFSNDRENFIPIPVSETENADFDIPIGDDASTQNILEVDHKYYKAVIAVGTSTTGTIEIHTKQ